MPSNNTLGQHCFFPPPQVPRRSPGRAVRRQVGARAGHPRHRRLHAPHSDRRQHQLRTSHRGQGHRRWRETKIYTSFIRGVETVLIIIGLYGDTSRLGSGLELKVVFGWLWLAGCYWSCPAVKARSLRCSVTLCNS